MKSRRRSIAARLLQAGEVSTLTNGEIQTICQLIQKERRVRQLGKYALIRLFI